MITPGFYLHRSAGTSMSVGPSTASSPDLLALNVFTQRPVEGKPKSTTISKAASGGSGSGSSKEESAAKVLVLLSACIGLVQALLGTFVIPCLACRLTSRKQVRLLSNQELRIRPPTYRGQNLQYWKKGLQGRKNPFPNASEKGDSSPKILTFMGAKYK